MKSFVKAIIAGCCIIFIGIIILVIALGLNGWTLRLHFSTEEFNSEQEINKVVVDKSVGSMKINYYDGDKIQIFYPTSNNYEVSVKYDDGCVRVTSRRPKWFEFSIWLAHIPETVINLPKDTTFELDLTVNAGSLRIQEGQYSKVRITVNAGSLRANNIECDTFNAKVNAGSMNINNITCHTSFKGEVNAGSLNAKNVICPTITAEVSAGSLNMTVKGIEAEYNISAHVSAGSSNLRSKSGTTDKKITANVSAGSLNVSFTS